MTREQFKHVISLLEKHNDACQQAYKLNIDIIDFNNDLHEVISILSKNIYGDDGYDWISWYMYERDFGKESLGAWDENKKPICRDIDELYDYIMREKQKI